MKKVTISWNDKEQVLSYKSLRPGPGPVQAIHGPFLDQLKLVFQRTSLNQSSPGVTCYNSLKLMKYLVNMLYDVMQYIAEVWETVHITKHDHIYITRAHIISRAILAIAF
jgi:hypothetical protein